MKVIAKRHFDAGFGMIQAGQVLTEEQLKSIPPPLGDELVSSGLLALEDDAPAASPAEVPPADPAPASAPEPQSPDPAQAEAPAPTEAQAPAASPAEAQAEQPKKGKGGKGR